VLISCRWAEEQKERSKGAREQVIHSLSQFWNRLTRNPEERTPARTSGTIAGVFQGCGAIVVAVVVGPKRAGKAVGFETIFGAAILGAVTALVLQAGGLLVYEALVHFGDYHTAWRPMNTLDVVEIGAGIGAGVGTALHLLGLALEEHAKEEKRKGFGDN
jgi:hypothetical protein